VLIYITWVLRLVACTLHAYNGAVLVPAGVSSPAVKRETRARPPAASKAVSQGVLPPQR